MRQLSFFKACISAGMLCTGVSMEGWASITPNHVFFFSLTSVEREERVSKPLHPIGFSTADFLKCLWSMLSLVLVHVILGRKQAWHECRYPGVVPEKLVLLSHVTWTCFLLHRLLTYHLVPCPDRDWQLANVFISQSSNQIIVCNAVFGIWGGRWGERVRNYLLFSWYCMFP